MPCECFPKPPRPVFPEAVMLKADGYYAVNYDEIIPVLVEGIKEQQSIIEKQIKQIEEHTKQIQELKTFTLQSNKTDEFYQ